MKKTYMSNIFIMLGIVVGIASGYMNNSFVFLAAGSIAELFVNFLKLISLPIVFLSITSTLSGMKSLDETKILGKKVLKYTISTTLIAATVALILYVVIQPVRSHVAVESSVVSSVQQGSYASYLLNIVPSNIVQAFSEGNVIGIAFISMILGLAIVALPEDNRKFLHTLFSSLFSALLKITSVVITLIPIGIWAFTVLFIKNMHEGSVHVKSLMLYIVCVVAANFIQGFIVLPLMLKWKGLSPTKIAKAVSPALIIAFFTKSSTAALPTALQCSEKKLGVSRKVSTFSLPLCSVVNMNGCAAFILTTVLFVSMSHGVQYTAIEMGMWVIIATIAAIGNAGIPMGCYFLSSAFIAGMNLPLHIMGTILSVYTIIDMIETSLNVWSDICITSVVDKELKANKVRLMRNINY